MQLTINISEKDLAEFGRESVQKEIDNMLRWMKIRQAFGKLSEGVRLSFDEHDYHETVEEIRESFWDEYKRNMQL